MSTYFEIQEAGTKAISMSSTKRYKLKTQIIFKEPPKWLHFFALSKVELNGINWTKGRQGKPIEKVWKWRFMFLHVSALAKFILMWFDDNDFHRTNAFQMKGLFVGCSTPIKALLKLWRIICQSISDVHQLFFCSYDKWQCFSCTIFTPKLFELCYASFIQVSRKKAFTSQLTIKWNKSINSNLH